MAVRFYGKFSVVVDGELHTWSIESLVKASASLEITEVPLTELDKYLDINGWFDEDRQPTGRAIVEHYKRMQAADLAYPIIVSTQYGLMDGMHRLLKAYLAKEKSIKAVIFECVPDPDTIESTLLKNDNFSHPVFGQPQLS